MDLAGCESHERGQGQAEVGEFGGEMGRTAVR